MRREISYVSPIQIRIINVYGIYRRQQIVLRIRVLFRKDSVSTPVAPACGLNVTIIEDHIINDLIWFGVVNIAYRALRRVSKFVGIHAPNCAVVAFMRIKSRNLHVLVIRFG